MSTAPATQALPRPAALTAEERLSVIVLVGSAALGLLFPLPMMKTILGVVVTLTFVYVSIRAFYLGVAFFTFILPLQTLVENQSVLIRGINLQTAFILFFVFVAVITAKESEQDDDLPPNPLVWPIVGLVITVVFSSFHAYVVHHTDLGDQLSRVKNWFSYSVFVILGYKFIREPRQKLFVLSAILLTTVFNAIYSMKDIVQNPSLNLEGNRAVSLIAVQPNLYGGFLALYIFLFLALLIHYPLKLKGRLLVVAGTVLVLINLVYTLSRGAWLAAIVAATLISTLKSRKLLIPMLLIAGGIYLWTPDVAQKRFQEGFEGEYDPKFLTQEDVTHEEAASRIIQWKSFPGLLMEKPVFGVGFGQYGATIFKKKLDVKPRSAHSSVIEIAIEEGLIGLFFYLMILWIAFRSGSRLYRQSDDPLDKALALGLMAATVSLLVLDLTGTRFRNSNIMAFYWIVAGMTLNGLRPAASKVKAEAGSPRSAGPVGS